MTDPKKRRIDDFEAPTSDNIKRWLSGLSRERAISFISDIASRNQTVFDDLQNILNQDPDARRLFIRSLDWNTNDETLRSVFSEFGEIEDCKIIHDQNTNRSKGFAFIVFETAHAAQRALSQGTVEIDGRNAFIHLASEKNERPSKSSFSFVAPSADKMSGSRRETKIFIHGLSWNTTSETLRNAFEPYGEIEEATIAFNRDTQKSKGYGFVTFISPESATAASIEPNRMIDGRLTRCNLASERRKADETSVVTSTVGIPMQRPSVGGFMQSTLPISPAIPSISPGVGVAYNQIALQQALLAAQPTAPAHIPLADIQIQLQQIQAQQLALQRLTAQALAQHQTQTSSGLQPMYTTSANTLGELPSTPPVNNYALHRSTDGYSRSSNM